MFGGREPIGLRVCRYEVYAYLVAVAQTLTRVSLVGCRWRCATSRIVGPSSGVSESGYADFVTGFDEETAHASARARRAWLIGGVLLIAATVLGLVLSPIGLGIVGDLVFAAAVLVFAFGIRGAGSVTARRPLGTTALTVLAVWTVVGSALMTALATGDFGLQVVTDSGSATTPFLVANYVDIGIQFVASLIAVVQIGRAGVVPRPWSWAPAWALAGVSIPWIIDRMLWVSQPVDVGAWAYILSSLDGLVRIGAGIFLGTLAIVLANIGSRSRTVPVYPPQS